MQEKRKHTPLGYLWIAVMIVVSVAIIGYVVVQLVRPA